MSSNVVIIALIICMLRSICFFRSRTFVAFCKFIGSIIRLSNIVLVIANPFLTGLSQLTVVRALAVNVTVWERTGPIIHFNRSSYYVYLSTSSSCEDWLNLVCCKRKKKEEKQ